MADPGKNLPPGQITGTDLRLSTRGILGRLANGEKIASAIMTRFLRQLLDDDGHMAERAPHELARCRSQFFRSLDSDQHAIVMEELGLLRLQLEERKLERTPDAELDPDYWGPEIASPDA